MIWPGEIAVPTRPVKGLRDAPIGVDEGELCMRPHHEGPCLGKLELRRNADLHGCTCFQCAPCGSCMSEVPECPGCGWRAEEPN